MGARSRRPAVLVLVGLLALALLALQGATPLPVGLRAAAGLAVLGGAAAVTLRWNRTARPRRAIELLDQRPLTREAGLALIQVGGRTLLVGYGHGGARLLSAVEASCEALP